jgi:hypothetical protein
MSRTTGEAQSGATPPPRTEVPEAEHVEWDAFVVSLGIMVTVQIAASTSTGEAVLAGGLPQERLVLPGTNAELP